MLNKVLNFLGYTLIKSNYLQKILIEERRNIQNNDLHNYLNNNFFTLIKETGIVPSHIIDVGANHGDWTRMALKYFPDADYSMIEPQAELNQYYNDILTNSKIRVFNIGLGRHNGIFKFTIADSDDASTFRLSEADAKKTGLKQIDVEVKSLDNFINNQNLPIPDIIKIDAEGLDLDVLNGASSIFGFTEVIIVEAAVMASGLDNTVDKIVEFMKHKNYKLFDILDLNRPIDTDIKYLMLIELAFIKNEGKVDVFYS